MNFIALPILRSVTSRFSVEWELTNELINLDKIINIAPKEMPDPANRNIVIEGCVLFSDRDMFYTTVSPEELGKILIRSGKILTRRQHRSLTFG